MTTDYFEASESKTNLEKLEHSLENKLKPEAFVEKVKKCFGFLETEYDFKLIHANNSDARPQTDGVVKYASNTTLVSIDSEIGEAAVRLCRVQDDERYYLDPVTIHEYLNTSKEEKIILLSTNIKDNDDAQTIFRKTFLLESSRWINRNYDSIQNLENRLKNYAHWLKNNAKLCLLGDFLQWPVFYEYKIGRLYANEIRRGGKNTVLAIVKDENGKLKQIERPILQRERDHLIQLKREILG